MTRNRVTRWILGDSGELMAAPRKEGIASIAEREFERAVAPAAVPAADRVVDSEMASLAKLAVHGIVAIYFDSRGRLAGTTITRQAATPAGFRAAFRSLPMNARQVTFACRGTVDAKLRAVVLEYCDVFLVKLIEVLDDAV